MKSMLIIKRIVFLLFCIIFTLPQCSKNDFFDEYPEPNEPEAKPVDPVTIDPLFDYSSIAFIANIPDDGEGWRLCIMDKSGNNMQKIVDKAVSCQKPVRSHSGTQLLFTAIAFDYWKDENNISRTSSQFELYIVNTDGTGLTLIDRIGYTENGNFGNVAWSPDDSQIVYVRTYDDYWEKTYLILYNIPDNTHTILQTEGNVCSPKFSPDGKQIAYCSTVKTDIDIVYMHSHYNHHIYKMDVNGNNNQLIISNASSPKWSPQGDKIMYIISGKNGSSQISVANADGSNRQQLTASVAPGWWDTGFPRDGNGDPQWTPDGEKIVYVSWENGKSEIFIMNVDGSEQTRLTRAEFRDEYPEVTPDGKYILFSSRRSEMMGLSGGTCIMTLDGKNEEVLYRTGSCPIACR